MSVRTPLWVTAPLVSSKDQTIHRNHEKHRIPVDVNDKSDIDLIHEIGSRIAAADPLHDDARPRRGISSFRPGSHCDSCLLSSRGSSEECARAERASKTPHPDVVDRLKLRVGEAIDRAGWRSIANTPWRWRTRERSRIRRFQTVHS
jgi:hypothetical protein